VDGAVLAIFAATALVALSGASEATAQGGPPRFAPLLMESDLVGKSA
jgi:hypothetical protein